MSEAAFEGSTVKTVKWSKGCGKIPSYCFYRSDIEEITNVENVCEIGESAFAYVFNKLKLDLSSALLLKADSKPFLFVEKENISKPYYMSDSDFNKMF